MTSEELEKLGIPKDLHETPLLKEVKDLPTLAKVAVDLKAYQGSSIRIPGPEASEDDKKSFNEKLKKANPNLFEMPADQAEAAKVEDTLFERLGKPKDRTGYPALKDLGIETKMDEEGLRQQAAELGLTKKQYERMAKSTAKIAEERNQKESALAGELRKELGQAFEERLTAAAVLAKKAGLPDEFVQKLKNGAVPVAEAKGWIALAKGMNTEPGELGGQPSGGSSKITPAEAKERIAELYRNPALFDKSHPQHDELVKKLHEYTAATLPQG